MDVAAFDYELPPALIAQEPLADRAASRLLALDRATGAYADRRIDQLPSLLQPGDVVVVNDTRVFPARLLGQRPSGGRAECLLARRVEPPAGVSEDIEGRVEWWEALVHPGQKLKVGSTIEVSGPESTLHIDVRERRFFGRRLVRVSTSGSWTVEQAVEAMGHVPLPPYIKRHDSAEDRDRYQTIFARHRGSIAAPTAGLHFNPALLAALDSRGVRLASITLHVGYGTFQPVRSTRVEDHRVDAEDYHVDAAAANEIEAARAEGRRVVAVGTTTTRVLESVAGAHDGHVAAGSGTTDLFIYPGFEFRVIRGLLTNLHLPRSSLLMLVAAFAGREAVLAAYRHAVHERYRFFSYGDAMLVV